jgi:hypothetical protein
MRQSKLRPVASRATRKFPITSSRVKLPLMKKTAILLSIAATFSLFFGGCATAARPKYLNTEQKDSASVGVGQTLGASSPYAGDPNVSINNKFSDVFINKIDDLEANFPARGVPFFDTRKQLYISPGKHALVLTFNEIDDCYVYTGSGTVEAEFTANHIYRITACAAPYTPARCIFAANYTIIAARFDVTLWDETGGIATRASVGNWGIDGQQSYVHPDPQ